MPIARLKIFATSGEWCMVVWSSDWTSRWTWRSRLKCWRFISAHEVPKRCLTGRIEQKFVALYVNSLRILENEMAYNYHWCPNIMYTEPNANILSETHQIYYSIQKATKPRLPYMVKHSEVWTFTVWLFAPSNREIKNRIDKDVGERIYPI